MDKQVSFEDIHLAYPIISEYLCQTDRLNLHSTNRTIRQLTTNQLFWPSLELSNLNSQSAPISLSCIVQKLSWVFKSLQKYKSKSLTIFIHSEDNNQQLMTILVNNLMQGALHSITKLDIYCESDDVHLACSLAFPNLQQLVIRSKCVNNQLLKFMSQNILNLQSLVVEKNDLQFTCKNISQYIKKPMKKLVVKPYAIDFQEIQKLAQIAGNTLKQIQIDVQECSKKSFARIFKFLTRLEKLRLYHMQNFESDNELVQSLRNTCSKIQELAITKAYSMQISRILSAVSTKNLLTLDITDSKLVNDNDIKKLAQKCTNLKNINISWCNGISGDGVKILLQSCLKLQRVDLTGIKQAKDIVFGQYNDLIKSFNEDKFTKFRNQSLHNSILKQQDQNYEPSYFFNHPISFNKIKILRRLKYLQCQSCNGISDNILKIVYIVNRQARIYNYYGNYMGLFAKQQQSTFC